MTKAKHTPGPWEWAEADTGSGQFEQLHDYQPPCIFPLNREDEVLAWMDEGLKEDEVLSNARLMAAAPELLAALQHCLLEHGGFTIKGETERVARAAIAKATGAA